MRILAIDVGTGTQDILLFDSEAPVENGLQLVMPSPTQIVARKVRAATAAGRSLALHGPIMGGGPCHWAVEDHLRAGLAAYATPSAATTFNDDLAWVEREMGVRLLSEDELAALPPEVERIRTGDVDLAAVDAALGAFGVLPDYDGVAVAVFDHGAAPPDVSDRVFRFRYLAERFAGGGGLLALGFRRDEVPVAMTRLRAAAEAVPAGLPTVVMDTAPAAILGALDDPLVAAQADLLAANVGNFHCLAFHIVAGRIAGCFEHHTGELKPGQLERYLQQLGEGTISNQEVYETSGHGALVLQPTPGARPFLAVTGPRRSALRGSTLWPEEGARAVRPYMAVPHGDMMLAGCFGLLRAFAARYPEHAGAIARALAR
ncbi:MAG TPA: DUF1786 family protein [Roseiflexaceae bacterium]|nr:DUF1786 family protein [Roseiflexaceae bacterium]